ncbi:TIGR03885 family FMN-dependent LLM class oxidoreductase [Salinimicrobium tongyeongense]|uniref:TIGR03885 family FMN-dependent LLM class oxidoreductase n=1 Tax=Salinimicrobium tongyeongense TaxID=2809707 RepID=A0ABY6NRJ4_9FLAO|nr:TIGR03885 family FMN-dependent LLM class oxidoreductase [Salinimicrobium tongyeongense]UZH55108.1 TIGR03885 family FMN-dependent LLM class oxidoreductase [Salinimicrobium tongyeongense]
MKIGYHASHEQFTPRHLLKLVQQAEDAGFKAVLSSDHFHPWSDTQGESGFAWSWLGAAMQATNLEFGIVNAPGQRYHPAIIAQAVATLDQMFPGRFFLCSGSGQLLNENITGEKWPAKRDRNKRLQESVEVMQRLWREDDYLNHKGMFTVERAKLFTKPAKIPTVFGAAITEKTAAWLSTWADAMITISKPKEELEKMVKAFRNGGGKKKPMALKVQISYARNRDKALDGAWEQWKNNIYPSKVIADIDSPEKFDAMGQNTRKEDVEKHVIVGSDADTFIEKIKEYESLGFEKIVIHNVNKQQEDYIDFFKKEVLPNFNQN